MSWLTEPRWLAALLIPAVLLRCFILAPLASLRYLGGGLKRFGLDAFRRFYLDAELVRLHPDLVHFEFGALAVGRTYLKKLLGVHLSASFRGHDLNFVGLDMPDYYSEVWRSMDSVHLLGEYLWGQAQKRGCPAGLPHSLIPPAIDPARFTPRDTVQKLEAGPLRILSVGRLAWSKGYEYSIQAVRLLIDMGIPVEYRIVGAGDFLEAAAFASHQLGCEEVVSFLGPLESAGVIGQMDWADVFLHPAVEEGFSNAVIEAQAMQLPVVCSDAGGLPENVEDGVTGFVVPRRDPQALAEKLAILAADPSLREIMGRAGRQRVESHFSLPRQISSFDSFYRAVLKTPPG